MAFGGFPSETSSMDDLSGAAGDIVDSVIGGFMDTLTGNGPYQQLFTQPESDFKQYSETVTDRSKWTMIATDTTVSDYVFILKYKGKSIQVPFNINPERESVSEPNSATVTYTQGGGKIIQAEGCISKDITISGQCGLYPNQKGRTPLPTSGIGSGLESFKMLQNIFRRYCFLQRYGDLTKGLQLIYINRRKQESWVVHPKTFTSEDAKEHNNSFSYNIVLETLYPYDGKETKGLIENLMDSIPGWRQASAVIQRVAEVVDQVNATAGQISSIINSFGTTVLAPVVSLANSFADLKAGRLPNLSNFKRDSVKDIVRSLGEVHAALEAAGQDDLAAPVARLQRQINSTLLIDGVYDSTPQVKAVSVTTLQANQMASYVDGQGNSVAPTDASAAGAVGSRPDSGKMLGGSQAAPNALPGTATLQAQQQATIKSQNFRTISTVGGSALDPNGKFQTSRFIADPAEIKTAIPPSTLQVESQLNWNASWNQSMANINPNNVDYRTGVVNNDDSIQTLAFRLLGESARWVELVLLNNLRYPYLATASYIAANSLTNVLAYGSSVIYPVPKQTANQSVRVWRNETFQSLALSPFERSLGNDILIDENTNDAVWGANDLMLVYGVDNIKQFMRFCIVTIKSSYRRSPRAGFSQYLGISAGISAALVKAESQSIFLGDDRIVSSDAVTVSQVGSELRIGIAAYVRDQQEPILVSNN